MDLSRPRPPDPYTLLPAVPTFTLTSQDLTADMPLDKRHAAANQNASPQLSWTDFPANTRSFAVTCFDPDAPTASGYWHWLLIDLPATATSLERGAGGENEPLPGNAFHIKNDSGTRGYYGAAPPKGDHLHRYYFVVHAVGVEHLPVRPISSPAQVGFNLTFHTLARAKLMSTYSS